MLGNIMNPDTFSKRLDEALLSLKLYSAEDNTLKPADADKCFTDAKAAIKQLLSEVRLDEIAVLDKYLGINIPTDRGERRVIFVEDMPVRIATIKAMHGLTGEESKT